MRRHAAGADGGRHRGADHVRRRARAVRARHRLERVQRGPPGHEPPRRAGAVGIPGSSRPRRQERLDVAAHRRRMERARGRPVQLRRRRLRSGVLAGRRPRLLLLDPARRRRRRRPLSGAGHRRGLRRRPAPRPGGQHRRRRVGADAVSRRHPAPVREQHPGRQARPVRRADRGGGLRAGAPPARRAQRARRRRARPDVPRRRHVHPTRARPTSGPSRSSSTCRRWAAMATGPVACCRRRSTSPATTPTRRR
jgi:hypothetical protein